MVDYRSDKLPPPPKTQDWRELYHWQYRVFEILNGIVTTLADQIEVEPSGSITGTTAQEVTDQIIVLLENHDARHESGGADEMTLTGMTGLLATPQTPIVHHTRHEDTGDDEIDVTGLSGLLADPQTPEDHNADHENGGVDEISVEGLSGLLADPQTPAGHNTSHENAGTDEISVAGLSGELADDQPPKTHGAEKHNAVYGSVWGNEINWSQASAAQNTWYEVADADMADGQLSGVTHDGSGKLTVGTAGKYLVNYAMAVECSAPNTHVQSTISISGTETDDGIMHYEVLTANAQVPMSGTAILSLAENATVEISLRTTDAGTPNLSVDHLNISVVLIGA